MLAYLLFRFGVEFIKPRETPIVGLSAIQLACLAGAAVCVTSLWTTRRATLSHFAASPPGATTTSDLPGVRP
jgi:hypothetical protein